MNDHSKPTPQAKKRGWLFIVALALAAIAVASWALIQALHAPDPPDQPTNVPVTSIRHSLEPHTLDI